MQKSWTKNYTLQTLQSWKYNRHTHPFIGPFPGTTRVSRYQKGETILDFTEARVSEWQWHQLGHMQVCTSLQTDNHVSTPPLSFLQAGCPSCRSTNSVKALKAHTRKYKQTYPAPVIWGPLPLITDPVLHNWDRHLLLESTTLHSLYLSIFLYAWCFVKNVDLRSNSVILHLSMLGVDRCCKHQIPVWMP